jgi:hypothetical protein
VQISYGFPSVKKSSPQHFLLALSVRTARFVGCFKEVFARIRPDATHLHATGITAHIKNGGRLEVAQQLANP